MMHTHEKTQKEGKKGRSSARGEGRSQGQRVFHQDPPEAPGQNRLQRLRQRRPPRRRQRRDSSQSAARRAGKMGLADRSSSGAAQRPGAGVKTLLAILLPDDFEGRKER